MLREKKRKREGKKKDKGQEMLVKGGYATLLFLAILMKGTLSSCLAAEITVYNGNELSKRAVVIIKDKNP